MSKDEMIQKTAEAMQHMFYEDVEFFYKFATGFVRKKGILCPAELDAAQEGGQQ